MTEHDYLLVSALQRLRAAGALIQLASPDRVMPGLSGHLKATTNNLADMIIALEDEVEKERDKSPD